MPIHDWTRVKAGIFHDFHLGWVAALRHALNNGVLPRGYYALAEQTTRSIGPDLLALELGSEGIEGAGAEPGTYDRLTSAVVAPPRVAFTAVAGEETYVRKRRTLAIRHVSGDRLIALIEVVSPGNKAARDAFRTFVDKVVAALGLGLHVMVLDLFPPGRRDPFGLHAAIWNEWTGEAFAPPAGKPLTLASYAAGAATAAYVEPVAVGDRLPDMPLFLEPEGYVNVPLEATYEAAWQGFPSHLRATVGGT